MAYIKLTVTDFDPSEKDKMKGHTSGSELIEIKGIPLEIAVQVLLHTAKVMGQEVINKHPKDCEVDCNLFEFVSKITQAITDVDDELSLKMEKKEKYNSKLL